MTDCSSIDLKAFFLGELSPEERRLAESHTAACGPCREELARLGLAQGALLSLRDEEIPRRIAFVSDKVFEPRWWQRWWQSGPRAAFASAAMVALAILAHALIRPAPVAGPSVETASVEARIQTEVSKRLTAALAESEARQSEKAAVLVKTALAEAEQRFALDRRADLVAVEENYNYLRKQMNKFYMVASADVGGPR